jgi:hypothetical protein
MKMRKRALGAHTVWVPTKYERAISTLMKNCARALALLSEMIATGKIAGTPLKDGGQFTVWSGKRETGVAGTRIVLRNLPRKRMKKGGNRLIHPAGTFWLLADANGELKRSRSGFYQFVDDVSTEGHKVGEVKTVHIYNGEGYFIS